MAFALDEHAPEEYNIITEKKCVAALFVETSCQPWVVQELEGNFCLLPAVVDPWPASTVLPEPTGRGCTRLVTRQGRASSRPAIPTWANAGCIVQGTCRCCSRKTTPTRSASLVSPTTARTSRTASTTTSSMARQGR